MPKSIHYEGRLIRVERRQRYGTIVVDPWSDNWDLPEPCQKQLASLLEKYNLFPCITKSGFDYHRVPLAILDEVARGVADIIAPYRPAHES